MLGQIAFKLGLKTVESAGGALYSAAGAVSKVGKAFGTVASAASSASQNMSAGNSANNTIIRNTGMAGSAGRQKVSGSGTLPPIKANAKPHISDKMPTEALLSTAVKYLASIDKSLKSQLQFEKMTYDEQARDAREAIIESKPSATFSDMRDRLSGFKSDVQSNVSTSLDIAKFVGAIGVAAALVASSLDQKELDALKQNIDQFKKTFGWLGDLAGMIPAGGIAGFLFGGRGLKGRLRGGMVGIVAELVAEVIYNRMTGQGGTGSSTGANLAAMAGIGYLGFRGAKSASRLLPGSSNFVGSKFSSAKAGLDSAKNIGTTFRDAKTGARVGSTANFFASPRWRKFLAWLAKKGRGTLVKKIETRIAIAVGSAAVASTGIGAAVGVLGILIDVLGSLYLAYEIYQLWQDFTSSEKAEKAGAGDAEIAKELDKSPDAQKVTAASLGATAISKSETGRPEEAQAFFENNGWSKEQAAGIVGNLVVESGLRTDAVGDNGQAYGIAQWHPDRQRKFQQIFGKPITQSSFAEQLEFVNWELNNSEKQAGDALRGATTAAEAASIVDSQYERSSGAAIAQRVSNANAVMSGDYGKLSTGGASGYSGATTRLGAALDSGVESLGQLFGALGSNIIKPGVERTFTPSTPNVSERINKDSMQLQNQITFGINASKRKDSIVSPTIPGTSSGNIQPGKSISSMDPNYKNLDVLTKYLAHFRMAA